MFLGRPGVVWVKQASVVAAAIMGDTLTAFDLAPIPHAPPPTTLVPSLMKSGLAAAAGVPVPPAAESADAASCASNTGVVRFRTAPQANMFLFGSPSSRILVSPGFFRTLSLAYTAPGAPVFTSPIAVPTVLLPDGSTQPVPTSLPRQIPPLHPVATSSSSSSSSSASGIGGGYMLVYVCVRASCDECICS